MDSVAALSAALRSSPYDDGQPSFLQQLFGIRQQRERVEDKPFAVSDHHKVRFPEPVLTLSVEQLQRRGAPAGGDPSSITPNLGSTGSKGLGNLSPLTTSHSSPIQQNGCSPVTTDEVNRRRVQNEEVAHSSALYRKRMQATSEFTDGLHPLKEMPALPRGQGEGEQYPLGWSKSQCTAPFLNGNTTANTTGGIGITSDLIAHLSMVDATAGGASAIHGDRSVRGGGLHSTLVEEDMVMGLAREERGLNLGPVKSRPPVDTAYVDGDDVDDYPLLSPMDQSKVASPSIAGGVGIWEKERVGARHSLSRSSHSPSAGGPLVDGVGGFDKSTRSASSGVSAVVVEGYATSGAAAQRGDDPLLHTHRHIASQQPVMYSSYIGELEMRIREEAAKAAAIEFQTLRAQLHTANTRQSAPQAMLGAHGHHLAQPNIDEMRLREDFARELYRVKQQLEELRFQHHEFHQRTVVLPQNPVAGGVAGSPLRRSGQSLALGTNGGGSPNRVVHVKVVKGYEDEPVPYAKPKRPPPAPSLPSPTYSSSFYTQSPSPKKSKRGGRSKGHNSSSIAYSSFDTTVDGYGNGSFLSESIASYTSEPID